MSGFYYWERPTAPKEKTMKVRDLATGREFEIPANTSWNDLPSNRSR